MLQLQNYYAGIVDILRASPDKRCTLFFSIPNPIGDNRYCALGTIGHYFGIPDKQIFSGFMKQRPMILQKLGLPVALNSMYMKCPRCGAKKLYFGLIAHLNDHHNLKWGDIASELEISKEYPSNASTFCSTLDEIKAAYGYGSLWELYHFLKNRISF